LETALYNTKIVQCLCLLVKKSEGSSLIIRTGFSCRAESHKLASKPTNSCEAHALWPGSYEPGSRRCRDDYQWPRCGRCPCAKGGECNQLAHPLPVVTGPGVRVSEPSGPRKPFPHPKHVPIQLSTDAVPALKLMRRGGATGGTSKNGMAVPVGSDSRVSVSTDQP